MKSRIDTAAGLSVHMSQVHKENLTAVDNALPNRAGLDIEIFGMEGIPDEVAQQHTQRVLTSYHQAQADRQAATGNPVPGAAGANGLKKPKMEATSDLKKRLAEHKAAKLAAEQGDGSQSGSGTPQPTSHAQASPSNGYVSPETRSLAVNNKSNHYKRAVPRRTRNTSNHTTLYPQTGLMVSLPRILLHLLQQAILHSRPTVNLRLNRYMDSPLQHHRINLSPTLSPHNPLSKTRDKARIRHNLPFLPHPIRTRTRIPAKHINLLHRVISLDSLELLVRALLPLHSRNTPHRLPTLRLSPSQLLQEL